MRWAFWPHQWHPEVLGDEQHHCFRNLLGSTGGQGITEPLKSIKKQNKTKKQSMNKSVIMVVLYAYKTYLNTDLHGDKFEKHLFSFSTLKWHPFPDGRDRAD